MYNNKKYYIICFIIGLIYDISYTNTGILNAFIFLLLGYIVSILNTYIKNNWISIIIISIIIIVLYRIITYFTLIFIDYFNFDMDTLINSIIYSLLFNILYILLMYIITNKVKKRRIYIKN